MKFHVEYPSALFANYINYYWEIETSTNEIIPEQLIYPEGSTELMFHFGKPFMSKFGDCDFMAQSQALFCGQKTTSAKVIASDTIGMFAINFKAFGASVFFNLPFNELVNSNLDAESFLGNQSNLILEKLAESKNHTERKKVVETYLLSKLTNENDYELPRLNAIQLRLSNLSVLCKVEDFAQSACVSYKTLDRLFYKRIGIGPKEYLKIERLKFAIEKMKLRNPENLTEIAYNSGYFDQSHFYKDFTQIVGIKPKEFSKLLESDPACLSTNSD